MRRALFLLALTLMPLSALAGGLLYLLWWLIPGPKLARDRVRDPALEAEFANLSRSRRIKLLLGSFGLLSLLTLAVCATPLWHLGGWLSHYLLPLLLIWGTYRALRNGRLEAGTLLTGLRSGSLALAIVGLLNYGLHWQTHLQMLCSPSYGGFCLLDLLLLAEDRARSFSMHPNVLGALMALAVPLWLLALGEARRKIPAFMALGAVLLCLLASFSRASWLAGACALLPGSFWLLNAAWRKGLWLSAGATLALLLLVGKLQPILARFGELLGGVGSHASRLTLWQGGLAMLRDHLWLGTGLLHPEPLLPAYIPPVAGGAGHLHNWYLQVAVESGLPAALCLFAALALLLGRPGDLSPSGRAAWLAWAGMILACCFDITLLDLRVAFVLCLLLGLILADRRAGRTTLTTL